MTSQAKRNNNPLNLRPGQPYEGLAVPSQAGGFCNFRCAVWGFRAAFRNYITKADRGINTITALITEWAPPGDNNNTAAYIAFVSSHSGIGATETINLKSWPTASAICYAQAEYESGEPFEDNWTLSQMSEGAFRAGITDAPAPTANKIASTIASGAAGVGAVAAAVQPQVETVLQTPHSPKITLALIVVVAVLAFAAAILRAKTKTEAV